MLTRRNLMAGAAAFSTTAVAPVALAGPYVDASDKIVQAKADGAVSVAFDLAERPTALPCFGGATLPMWTFESGTTFPIVRMKLGQQLKATFKNSLPRASEHASIHWHGLRIPNVEDGVPYMTQQPIDPGETGRYAFTPPDTGSFFFHTHCNSVEHFGRGLLGALIVEGDEVVPSDADIVLLMKDWRLSPDGKFLPFSTDDGAAKAGTSGTVRSINSATKPVIKVPASANVRLRFYNVDPVRISEIGIENADAAIIAIDGNGLPPIPLESWRLGPAMRVDLMMRTPTEGKTVQLLDYFAKEPVVLAEFLAEGPPKRSGTFQAPRLAVMPYAECDVKNAQRIPFDFSATATGQAMAALAGSYPDITIGSLCLAKRTFWAINKQAWPGKDHSQLGPPLATLKSGQSYIFELKNLTPHAHPIHIHGHTFEILKSSIRKLPPFRADTVLLLPNERIEAGLVAGAPGKWMFHCHILEHQEAGMMGYIAVT